MKRVKELTAFLGGEQESRLAGAVRLTTLHKSLE